MAYFPYLGSLEDAGEYLKDNGYALKYRLKIQSLLQRKRQIEVMKKEILTLIDILQDKTRLQSPETRHDVLKKVRKLPIEWWERFFSLLLAVEGKNQPWALELKRELTKSSPYITLVGGLSFSEDEQIKIRDFIIFVLKKYQEQFGDEEGTKILAEKITNAVGNNEFKVVRNRLDADWSLTELRDNFKNPLLRSEFFDFWYMVMMNRTSDTEVRSRFRKALTQRSLKNAQPGQFWVMEYFFPAEKKKREIILSRLEDMWAGTDSLEQYTVLRVSRSLKIKNLLAKRIPDFKRADFQINREFYRKLLNSGRSTHYALAELFFLGDKNEENLWWLIL
jgi:hypothetical protein